MTRVASSTVVRLKLTVGGRVQGVGFRPFVYRLARKLGVAGHVRNDPGGVRLEIEGTRKSTKRFLELLRSAPAPASVLVVDATTIPARTESGFSVLASDEVGRRLALPPPDLVTCDACLHEVLDPLDRRFRHPFASCTACGPRFSIAIDQPWDRFRTSMGDFPLCDACRAEYDDPEDRRFHAETIACKKCGPRLEARTASGEVMARDEAAVTAAVETLRAGGIVAVKGLGGFQLVADSAAYDAIDRIRAGKRRPEKPLALMARDLRQIERFARVESPEAAALTSPAGPIVLLRRRTEARIAPMIAPGGAFLGFMLPTTPLHHLIAGALDEPLVATSGNRVGEPIATTDAECLEALGGIADLFLTHDRRVVHAVDDSVVRIVAGRVAVSRHARGYAPSSFEQPMRVDGVIATGGDLKAAVAFGTNRTVVLGPHVGDIRSAPTAEALELALTGLARISGRAPSIVACDAHPDGEAGRIARTTGADVRPVFHHHAHVLACCAEHGLPLPVLGVAWDGTGYGGDDTVWGGEFLRVDERGFQRIAHLRPFRLPGGDQAIREPRRAALGVLHEMFGAEVVEHEEIAFETFTPTERRVLVRMMERGVNAPYASSVGRLFDAVAAILGIRSHASFEGQAAIELESAALDESEPEAYPMPFEGSRLDWAPAMSRILADRANGVSVNRIAARFHATLADGIVAVARSAGEKTVALTGGCFQNVLLSGCVERALRKAGFRVLRHEVVPPNDGGLAVGQVVAAALERSRAGSCA